MGPIVNFSIWVYRRLLRFYPSDYRQKFEAEQAQVFRDDCLERHRRNGTLGILLLWVMTCLDLPRSVLGVRSDRPAKEKLTAEDWTAHLPVRLLLLFELSMTIIALPIAFPGVEVFLQERLPPVYTGLLLAAAVVQVCVTGLLIQALGRARQEKKH